MGHGDALQVSCLEGFDSLGLHQVSPVRLVAQDPALFGVVT
jgi:hypothetical protein